MPPKITAFAVGLLTIVASAAVPLAAQQSPFAAAFREFVQADKTVGASYALLDQGRITDSQTYGMADTAMKQMVDKNTVFHWASITKTLTAVAVMQLRERGKLSLDDPIVKFIPELSRVHSQDNGISRVTIRHLLSHTAGFQSATWPYKEGKPWEPFEPTEWSQLVAMMPYQELAFAPGTKFQYSNPAFIYLARVIEAITGDPYQVYVQKNILTPLGMTRSFYNVSPYYLAADRADSYEILQDEKGQEKVRPYPREFDTGITTPNGGLNAPVEDMAKWISFLAGTNSTLNPNTVLDRKSIEEMWRPVMPITEEGWATPVFVGLSFFLYPRGTGDNQVTFVSHPGHQAGFVSFFVLNPKNGRAIIVAANSAHGSGQSPAAAKMFEDSTQHFNALLERAMEVIR